MDSVKQSQPGKAVVAEPIHRTPHSLSAVFVRLLVVLLGIVSVIGVIHLLDREFVLTKWQAEEKQRVHDAAELFHLNIEAPLADLAVLRDNWNLPALNSANLDRLAQLFESFIKQNRGFHQIRFLDKSGRERLRIDRDGSEITRISEKGLQNKSSRTYFNETIKLPLYSIYVSSIDLNVENGRVELPIVPVVRYAIPVYSRNKQADGVIIINAFGSHILGAFEQRGREYPGQLMLLDAQGQWIFSEREEQRWGLQLGHQQTFADNEVMWQRINQVSEGQLLDSRQLLSFRHVKKPSQYKSDSLGNFEIAKSDDWFVVSSVDKGIIFAEANARLSVLTLVGLLFFLVLIPVINRWVSRSADLHHRQLLNNIFFRLMDESSDLIYVTDIHGTIIYANCALESVTGYSPEDVIGRHSRLFRSGKHDKEFYDSLWKSLREGKSFSRNFVNCKKNGELFVEFKTIFPVSNSDGKISYYVSVGKNMTELYQREKQQLNLLDSAVTESTVRFDHALALIFDYSQLVRDSLENRSLDLSIKFLDEIDEILERTRGIFKNITYAQDELAEFEYLLPIVKVLKRVVANQAGKSDAHQIELNISDDFVDTRCMNNAMSFVFNAIIENAIEASSKGGKIVIDASRLKRTDIVCQYCGESIGKDFSVITVTDYGKGISQIELSRIFEPYYTTKPKELSRPDYSGLGLTLVRKIVHSHSGHIGIRSEKGRFTEVSIYLPEVAQDLIRHRHGLSQHAENLSRYKTAIENFSE